jgi:pimeloyl-ACP methyl ester carboxylesterase
MSDVAPPRLVLFAGLGADERLFAPQRRLRAAIEVVRWIDPLPRESFAGYGRRIAQTIRSPRPFYIGGVSLGGMIALEVARHVNPLAVILISSCRSCADLPRWGRAGRGLVRVVPAWFQKWANVRCPVALRALGACEARDRELILQMIRDTPAAFLKWGLSGALRWRGVDGFDVPVYQIHGDCDRTIPCPASGIDRVIAGGGHLISLTHAEEVNAFIEERTALTGAGHADRKAEHESTRIDTNLH